jgi:hypothetical protein
MSRRRQAQLDNIEEDLNLVGTQLNTAISILNAGYVVEKLPWVQASG